MVNFLPVLQIKNTLITLTMLLLITACEGNTKSIPEPNDNVNQTNHENGGGDNTGGDNTGGGNTGGDNTGGGNTGGGNTGGDNTGGGSVGGGNGAGSIGGGANIGTGGLVIDDMGWFEISFGETFTFQPTITGDVSLCRKDLGHDDVIVDPETGKITWDTSSLTFGRGFYIRIKCSNYEGEVYASMIVHVDRSGTSRLRIAGQDGVSQYIGVAGSSMTGGDTIVFPDGVYPVSVSRNESYENAFKTPNRNQPVNGSSSQFSTLIAQTPGGVTISGEPQNGIPKQKNAIQLAAVDNVAFVGFIVKDVQREAVSGNVANATARVIFDFVGAAGAGTNLRACDSFEAASNGECSLAGMRMGGGKPLFQNSYDWGQNRYGIMTRSSRGSITRRSFVRLDEYRGDQPYGGFSNYCDSAHRSQDNTVFDSLAIAAPNYKNYAGLAAYPATGCQTQAAALYTEGLLAINNKLSLSLMDQRLNRDDPSTTPMHVWDYIVSYDNEGTRTPHTSEEGYRAHVNDSSPAPVHGYTANWLLQAKKETRVTNSVFGKSRGYGGGTDGSAIDLRSGGDVIFTSSVVVFDVPGLSAQQSPPRYLPESLLYFRGKSDTFFNDAGYDQVTAVRRYPIPGEDIMASNMGSYYNPSALRAGGGTIEISGNRGATAAGESMSEYFWGYLDDLVPPLAVRAKIKASANRVAWERLTGTRRDLITGWKVVCVSNNNTVLATLAATVLVYNDSTQCADYGVIAVYPSGDSGIAYIETAQLYN